jgi:hypothetical protein
MARGSLVLASLVVVAFGSSCVRDTDCGVCDPERLVLESISGIGYAAPKIHLLGPNCRGEECPGPIEKGSYFVEELVVCEDDPETKKFVESLVDRGAVDADDEETIAAYVREYCKISPLVVNYGLEFVFNNLLDPTSVELIRKRPDQPKLFEAYDWKTKILAIAGPTSRYNGDFAEGEGEAADVVTRLVSLACIDNLRDRGEDYSHEDRVDPSTDPCNRSWDHDDDDSTPLVPMKMRIGTPDAKLQSFRGTTTTGGNSCDTPQEGADTCCSECDFLLGTTVAKYGVDADGRELAPGRGAIECDPVDGDALAECRGFRIAVDRGQSFERTYAYYWDAPPAEGGTLLEDQPIPQYDRLRETHFDDRPAWIEQLTAKCSTDLECSDVHGLGRVGSYTCVGESPAGQACSPERDPECTAGVCRAQWFVSCQADGDTTGVTTGYCRDLRFDDAGAGACLRAGDDFKGQCDAGGEDCTKYVSGQRLANCNGATPRDAVYTADECCQAPLGGEDLFPDEDGLQCDPYFQSDLTTLARHDRNDYLPEQTRECVCRRLDDMSDEELELCGRVVESVCYDGDGLMPHREGQFAVKFVERAGGIVYDPAVKGIEWRAADVGSIPRARLENCAENAGLIRERTRLDGWRTNDTAFIENYEDYDRAMCSGQEYTVQFALPGDGEHIVDKVGNSMAGHAEYTFTTSQFHIAPGSGQPGDNLRIGACDAFTLVFSNKYDMSPENQRKLEIWRLDVRDPDDRNDDAITTPNDACDELVPVAGGVGCVETADELDDPCATPCLSVDVSQQRRGEVSMRIDAVKFNNVLQVGERYRITTFALDDIDDMADEELYQRAFWDACGMPLVAEAADPYQYDFTIDEPKCTEDKDKDEIGFSCDNADDHFNPDQADLDFDGVGDVIDLCPTVKGTSGNSADSDKDGVGNDCDACRQTTTQYNKHENEVSVPDYMFVRNVPSQLDADEDGIGDVCDNCVVTPNCEDYGPENPYEVGDSLAFEDATRCQRDDDGDLVGNACETVQLDTAAGPIGLRDTDDFDQDGVSNVLDACPRQPLLDRIECVESSECPDGRGCDGGVCDHLDTDDDTVGDICDSCPFSPNPMQTMDGETQGEDEDGDFVGDVCETQAACASRADPRPFAFHEVSVDGLCCTVQLVEEAGGLVNAITGRQLLDPYGMPVTLDCVEEEDAEDRTCRRLPSAVENAPGVLVPPPGCEDALADAGITALENVPLTIEVAGSLDALWNRQCFLPQTDQDSDGLGDPCDFCPFAYDPDNESFVDENGRVYPNAGKFCFGEFDPEVNCPYDDDDDTGTGSESGDATGSSGGSSGDTGLDTGTTG